MSHSTHTYFKLHFSNGSQIHRRLLYSIYLVLFLQYSRATFLSRRSNIGPFSESCTSPCRPSTETLRPERTCLSPWRLVILIRPDHPTEAGKFASSRGTFRPEELCLFDRLVGTRHTKETLWRVERESWCWNVRTLDCCLEADKDFNLIWEFKIGG